MFNLNFYPPPRGSKPLKIWAAGFSIGANANRPTRSRSFECSDLLRNRNAYSSAIPQGRNWNKSDSTCSGGHYYSGGRAHCL